MTLLFSAGFKCSRENQECFEGEAWKNSGIDDGIYL